MDTAATAGMVHAGCLQRAYVKWMYRSCTVLSVLGCNILGCNKADLLRLWLPAAESVS